MSLADDINTIANDHDHSAAIALLFDLLRHTPGLRQWLCVTMLDGKIRHRYDAYLDGKLTPPVRAQNGKPLLAWIAGVGDASADEFTHLRESRAVTVPTYGGLTRAQIFTLIRRYQAGPLALAPFLLLIAWRKAAAEKSATPAALRATQRFFVEMISGDAPALLHQLAHAAEFFHGLAPGTAGKGHYGHAAWWQLNLLTYILANPKPTYQTREFSRHLQKQKLHVDVADIRRFCRKHTIARDQTPGRPRR